MDGLRKQLLLMLSSFLYSISFNRSIKLQAETNFASYIDKTKKSPATDHISHPPRASPVAGILGRSSPPPPPPLPHADTLVVRSRKIITTNEHQDGVDFEGLIQSGTTTVKVTGLRKDSADSSLTALDLRLKANVTQDEVMHAIKDAGALWRSFSKNFLHI